MDSNTSDSIKKVLQILAVICALVLGSMILHKGSADVSALAEKHSGADFWSALAQYLIRNLAGG